MGIRYCMHCGMPVPRRAKICPECGASLKMPVPPNIQETIEPRILRDQPKPEDRTHRRKQTASKSAGVIAAGLIIVFCAAAFIILNVSKSMRNARSRHREIRMDEQRRAETTRPEIKIPEFVMPEFSVPDIQLPEAPAAAFSAESYAVETNLMGETVLYVNISYTNKAETPECFLTNFHITVQQDGKACLPTAGDPTRDNHLMNYVQPDETALISEAFIISTEKETTVSVAAFFGEGNDMEETIIPHADGTVTVRE